MESNQAAFTIQEMLPIGLTIVVLGIALAYGLQVMGSVQADMGDDSCAVMTYANGYDNTTLYNATANTCYNLTGGIAQVSGSSEYNATGDAITGVAKLP